MLAFFFYHSALIDWQNQRLNSDFCIEKPDDNSDQYDSHPNAESGVLEPPSLTIYIEGEIPTRKLARIEPKFVGLSGRLNFKDVARNEPLLCLRVSCLLVRWIGYLLIAAFEPVREKLQTRPSGCDPAKSILELVGSTPNTFGHPRVDVFGPLLERFGWMVHLADAGAFSVLAR